jgi:hypothetical protein
MKIHTTIDIDAPASAVWNVLGERFGDVAEWTNAIEASSLDQPLGQGAVRTCDLRAFGPVPAGKITEELTHFDRQTRSLTYVVLSGVPRFMRYVENAWSVEALGEGRSRVTSQATFHLAWWVLPMYPLLRIQLRRGLQSFVRELDAAATGVPKSKVGAAA